MSDKDPISEPVEVPAPSGADPAPNGPVPGRLDRQPGRLGSGRLGTRVDIPSTRQVRCLCDVPPNAFAGARLMRVEQLHVR
jgi:hypothetical protein